MTAQVLLCDGIGNVIQSIPFIKHLRTIYKRVVGLDRADSIEAQELVRHLFDEVKPLSQAGPGKQFSIPPLGKMGMYPEYKSWFKFHGIQEPPVLEINRDDILTGNGESGFDFVLWPGCKPNWKAKRWPYWVELAHRIRESGHNVALVGSKGEGDPFPYLYADLRGKLTLLQTGAVIDKSKYFIGNEGGLSHYANALQKRMWVIWGPTCPKKNMPPKRKGYTRIALDLDCQPCQFTAKGWNPQKGCSHTNCMNELTSGAVFTEIRKDWK